MPTHRDGWALRGMGHGAAEEVHGFGGGGSGSGDSGSGSAATSSAMARASSKMAMARPASVLVAAYPRRASFGEEGGDLGWRWA